MSSFKIYSCLPQEHLASVQVRSFTPLLIIDNTFIERKIKEEQSIFSEDESGCLDLKYHIGRCGECIAINYLKTIYKMVIDKSKDPRNGYDIKADNFHFEVKTTVRNANCFDISKGELWHLKKHNDISNLFFIKIDKNKVVGYNYYDLLKQFNLDLDVLDQFFINEFISIDAVNIRININEIFVDHTNEIDLTNYIPKEYDDGYESFVAIQNVLIE